MKNSSIIVLTLLLFAGCKRIDKFTKFNMDYRTSVVVESSSGINLPFNINSPKVETNSESTFQVNDTRKDLVEEIKLTDLTLTVTSPNNEDFSFLESIEIFISAPGIAERRIACSNPVPGSAGNILALGVTGADLKEFIKADEFTLRCNTITDEFLTNDHHVQVDATFFVDAKVLGQ